MTGYAARVMGCGYNEKRLNFRSGISGLGAAACSALMVQM